MMVNSTDVTDEGAGGVMPRWQRDVGSVSEMCPPLNAGCSTFQYRL